MRPALLTIAFSLALGCGGEPEAAPLDPTTGPGTTARAEGDGATLSVERLDAAAECDGLVPARVPEPVTVQLAPPAGSTCTVAVPDGTGAVALGAVDARGDVTWHVRARDGAPAATFVARGALAPQGAGWHGLDVRSGAKGEPVVALSAFAADGRLVRSQRVSPPDGSAVGVRWQLAPDPLGGSAVVLRYEDPTTLGDRFVLQRFDAGGVPRTATPAEVAFFMRGRTQDVMGAGVSRRGDALVMMPAQDEWRPTWMGIDGRWVGDGADRFSVVPAEPLELSPLLDGGLAVRTGGRWTRTFRHLARASDPAPAWLADRPGWTFRWTRGDRGYALLPPTGGEPAPGCLQSVELRAGSGRLCGRVTLRESGAACTARAVEQGPDGTLVQQSGRDACTYRWWPRLLAGG